MRRTVGERERVVYKYFTYFEEEEREKDVGAGDGEAIQKKLELTGKRTKTDMAAVLIYYRRRSQEREWRENYAHF